MPEHLYWLIAVAVVAAGPYALFWLACGRHGLAAAHLAFYAWLFGSAALALAVVVRLLWWVLKLLGVFA